MCSAGGPDTPKAVPPPVTAAGTRRRADVENRSRAGFAATILGSSAPGLTQGGTGRFGDLKTVLGA